MLRPEHIRFIALMLIMLLPIRAVAMAFGSSTEGVPAQPAAAASSADHMSHCAHPAEHAAEHRSATPNSAIAHGHCIHACCLAHLPVDTLPVMRVAGLIDPPRLEAASLIPLIAPERLIRPPRG